VGGSQLGLYRTEGVLHGLAAFAHLNRVSIEARLYSLKREHLRQYRLVHFPLTFNVGTITWPSLKTVLSTETNSGLSRIVSATLNEGSGFHIAPWSTPGRAVSVNA
jgi:hypothetical protein